MSLYTSKIRFLTSRRGSRLWRRLFRLRFRRGSRDFPKIIRRHVEPGRSFADIGCMWGVNGKYSFLAEELGAKRVVGVDVADATPEFQAEHMRRNSIVEFVHGDVTLPSVMERIGTVEVVFCAGVLYHHPSPYELILALREICSEKLLLGTATIPEVRGLPNAAVYYPMLAEADRRLWDLKEWGSRGQLAVQTPYQPEVGYSNWFWGMTPSCVTALLSTSGFTVSEVILQRPFNHLFVCVPTDKPVEELRGRLRIPG